MPPHGLLISESLGMSEGVDTILLPNGRCVNHRIRLLRMWNKGREAFPESLKVEGIAVFKPHSDADLAAFLERYEGTVVRNNAIGKLPASWNIKLTQDDRKPTVYVVRLNLDRVDLSRLPANAQTASIREPIEFS